MLKTHSSSEITDGGENRRYRYFNVSARKKLCIMLSFTPVFTWRRRRRWWWMNEYWQLKPKLASQMGAEQGMSNNYDITEDKQTNCSHPSIQHIPSLYVNSSQMLERCSIPTLDTSCFRSSARGKIAIQQSRASECSMMYQHSCPEYKITIWENNRTRTASPSISYSNED